MPFSGRISTLRLFNLPWPWDPLGESHRLPTLIADRSPKYPSAGRLSAFFCHANLSTHTYEPTAKVAHNPLISSPQNAKCLTFLLLYVLFLTRSQNPSRALKHAHSARAETNQRPLVQRQV
ncbi:hypothetical protein XENOCAPTIV_017116 [Xenoophorus captivus]|uniref:Uncharacterized protein n=1 Tax=Xenoophorus captivus TaxID=1517983 RepID=A0ABV0QSC0_9TELE